MKLVNLEGGYSIHLPTTGGKAGKGHNKTSTLQLRRDNGDTFIIVGQARFEVADPESRRKALSKLREKYNEARTPTLI